MGANVLIQGLTADGKRVPIRVDSAGLISGGIAVAETMIDSADASAGVDAAPAPGSGLKTVVDRIAIGVGAALDITFTEETSGTVIYKLFMAENEYREVTVSRKLPLPNKKLILTASGAGAVWALVQYHSEP
jgi:hypothetical protein